ncbi:acetylornithine transaminase [Actinocorallia longicatena]|uniref:Acetylornithine aminotransferase n=1 Tax=Actinocorallia longicatena TaxID=111803 RepID=A0ABP6QN25_9ACTN
MSSKSLQARYEAAFMPNYGVPPTVLVSGEGCVVRDADGESYLDLIGGIAVTSLGHGHRGLTAAIAEQAGSIAHTSNLFVNEPEIELAEELLSLLGGDARVFLSNSGTEANECALKMAIKFGKQHGRTYFVAAENGFHGRSMGALSLTGKAAIREPFGPFAADVRFVPFGDAEALRAAVGPECAAVFLEPTQGEGGVVPAPEGYFKAVREICTDAGALLVLDEIQSAIGRSGAWFAHQLEDIRPDILTLAKGLGGGLPIGACVGFGSAATIFAKGDHGSTFGGNPVSAAAALCVLKTIASDGLLGHARTLGEQWAAELAAVGHPLLLGVRGRGLWIGLVLDGAHAGAVQEAAKAAGFLVNAVQPDVVRLAPPLIITAEQARSFTAALPGILDSASPQE